MFKKKNLMKSLSICFVLSLFACSTQAPKVETTMAPETTETTIEETKEIKKSYPRVDGSTANMPMMAMIRSKFLGEDLEEAENNVEVTTTDYAWRSLVDGNADLLMVYEPSAETKKIIEESGVKLIKTPIGRDALVFIENETNSIDNLTTEQLQQIYTGEITNWKDLGGADEKIEAYQRELNSGSQTLFLNLLMKDKKPMSAPTKYMIQGMGALIEEIASYNDKGNAIGFSVYYYAKKMYEVPGLKLISVDGIAPNDETISKSEYPFLNEYYCVIREDVDKDSDTYKLYEFVTSSEGKAAMKEAGYVPID